MPYSCKVARFPFRGYVIIKRFGYIVLKKLWKSELPLRIVYGTVKLQLLLFARKSNVFVHLDFTF